MPRTAAQLVAPEQLGARNPAPYSPTYLMPWIAVVQCYNTDNPDDQISVQTARTTHQCGLVKFRRGMVDPR